MCVCIATSGGELASISMLHTHNCGNSSPFFCPKSYSICETIIFKPLWVTFLGDSLPMIGNSEGLKPLFEKKGPCFNESTWVTQAAHHTD